MTGNEPIALVEFGPADRQAVAGGGGVAIDAHGGATQEGGGCRRAGATRELGLDGNHFWLGRRRHDGGDVVRQDEACALAHLGGHVIERGRGCPGAELEKTPTACAPRICLCAAHQNHCQRSFFASSSCAGPSKTIRPAFKMTARSMARSVIGTFCSTTSRPVP